jgi:hypothetical protein
MVFIHFARKGRYTNLKIRLKNGSIPAIILLYQVNKPPGGDNYQYLKVKPYAAENSFSLYIFHFYN